MRRPATMPEGVSTGEPLLDDVSALRRAWTDGDQRALARLTPIENDELHRRLRVEETAEVLHVSYIIVMREWKTAKAWLYRELTAGGGNGSPTLDSRR